MYLKQLLIVLKALSTFSEEWAKGAGPDGGGKKKMMDVNAFVGGLKGGAIDQVNFLKLDTYLKNSKIASKVVPHVLLRCWSEADGGLADRRLRRQPRRRHCGKRSGVKPLAFFISSS